MKLPTAVPIAASASCSHVLAENLEQRDGAKSWIGIAQSWRFVQRLPLDGWNNHEIFAENQSSWWKQSGLQLAHVKPEATSQDGSCLPPTTPTIFPVGLHVWYTYNLPTLTPLMYDPVMYTGKYAMDRMGCFTQVFYSLPVETARSSDDQKRLSSVRDGVDISWANSSLFHWKSKKHGKTVAKWINMIQIHRCSLYGSNFTGLVYWRRTVCVKMSLYDTGWFYHFGLVNAQLWCFTKTIFRVKTNKQIAIDTQPWTRPGLGEAFQCKIYFLDQVSGKTRSRFVELFWRC